MDHMPPLYEQKFSRWRRCYVIDIKTDHVIRRMWPRVSSGMTSAPLTLDAFGVIPLAGTRKAPRLQRSEIVATSLASAGMPERPIGMQHALPVEIEAGGQLSDQRLPGESARMTALLSGLAQSRDQAVFAELFRFYAPRLKSYLRRLGSDDLIAEEIVQETMAAVWNKAALFDPTKANASTWIFTIARNLRIDLIRREKRPMIDDTELSDIPDQEQLPDQLLAQAQRAVAIRTAMQSLPADQALIVRLSFFEEQPHSAIAETLGLPLGTVKSRLRLAFNRFRKALGDLS